MYNHRLNCLSLDIWDYQVSKVNLDKCSKLYEFMFGNNGVLYGNIDYFLESLFITDSYDDKMETFQIEDFVISMVGYSTDVKNYKVKKSCDKNNLVSCDNIILKAICSKFLILLMNEINKDDINIDNYYKLVEWHINCIKFFKPNKRHVLIPEGWMM